MTDPAPPPTSKIKTGTVVRGLFTVVCIVLVAGMVLTQCSSVDASSCETTTTADKVTTEDNRKGGAASPKPVPAGAPVYLEVMSGDVALNRTLRTELEQHFSGHTIVERAGRHAPKNAIGAKLLVTMWAPKWFPFRASGTTQLEAALWIAGEKREVKGTLTSVCTGLVNKELFMAAEKQRMLDWAKTALTP